MSIMHIYTCTTCTVVVQSSVAVLIQVFLLAKSYSICHFNCIIKNRKLHTVLCSFYALFRVNKVKEGIIVLPRLFMGKHVFVL